MIAIGSLAGALLLIKINIGIYVLASLAMAPLTTSSARRFSGISRMPWASDASCFRRRSCGITSTLRGHRLTASVAPAVFGLLKARHGCVVTMRDAILVIGGFVLIADAVTAALGVERVPLSSVLDAGVFLVRADLFPVVAPFVWLVFFTADPAERDVQEFPRTVLCSVTVFDRDALVLIEWGGRFPRRRHSDSDAGGDRRVRGRLSHLALPASVQGRPGLCSAPGIATLSLVAIAAINLGIAVNRYRFYSGLPSLGLPCTQRIHLDPPQRAELVSIRTNVAGSCDVFEDLPGLTSLNFWTEKEPATGINWNGWTLFFTPEQQQQIVHALSAHSQACVVYNPALAALWDLAGHQDFEIHAACSVHPPGV
jgi:hypothetical protein